MTIWHEGTVSLARPAAELLTELWIDVSGSPLVGAHKVPGQYVKLALEGVGENHFAIASAPSTHRQELEFLLKAGTPLTDALSALPKGAKVRLTEPAGKGFPLDQARGRDLILVATGSGISPIHSVIETIRADRASYGHLTLLFGVRTANGFAYKDKLAEWERDGVRVVRTVSQPGASGWTEATGYVQRHLGGPHPKAVAFLCGQKAMVQAVTEELARQGVPKDRVFLNF